MRDWYRYYEKAVDICYNLDLPIREPEKVAVNKRFKNLWGRCKVLKRHPNGKIDFLIELNQDLLDERNSEEGLIETLLHELIHTCPNCWNHGKQWKAYAEKVNKTYGYHIKVVSSSDDKGLSEECKRENEVKALKRKHERKYELTCQKCGHVYRYARATKGWLHCENYACGVPGCKGKLKRTGEMVLMKPIWN